MRRSRVAAVAYGLLAAGWICVLFFFSGQSGADSGSLSLKLTKFLFGPLIRRGAELQTLHHIVRKLAHMGVFAVEGFFLASALLRAVNRKKALLISLAVCVMLAVANELHQLTAVARSCSPVDMLIDSAGAVLGILFAALIHWLMQRRRT